MDVQGQAQQPIALAAEAVANPPGLPAIGRWMIAARRNDRALAR